MFSVDELTALREREFRRHAAELMLRRASADPRYFIDQFVKVASMQSDQPAVPFRLWPCQVDALNILLNKPEVVVLKARQLGLTTLCLALALHQALFREGPTEVVITSHRQDAASANLRRLRDMYRHLPEWVRAVRPVTRDSESRMAFSRPDGSEATVHALPPTATAGAGLTASMVVLDELALVDDQVGLLRAVRPTVQHVLESGQWQVAPLVIVSTSRGPAGLFFDLWQRAADHPQMGRIFLPWNASPLMSADAREEAIRLMGDAAYAEYPETPEEAFRSRTGRWIPELPSVLDLPEPPIRMRPDPFGDGLVPDEAGPWRFWEEPDPAGPTPVLALDPASARGRDPAAAHMVVPTVDGLRIVGWFHDKGTEGAALARAMAAAGRHYAGRSGPALLVVERAGGWGDSVLAELERMRYPALYRHRQPGGRRGYQLGFPTSKTTRPLVLAALREMVVSGRLGGLHPALVDELSTMVVDENGRPGPATKNTHDDLVMSLALAVWVSLHRGGAPVAADAPADHDPVTDPVTEAVWGLVRRSRAEGDRLRRHEARTWRTIMRRLTV